MLSADIAARAQSQAGLRTRHVGSSWSQAGLRTRHVGSSWSSKWNQVGPGVALVVFSDAVHMGRKGEASERVSLKRRLDDEAEEEEEEYEDADKGDDGEADEGEDEFMPPVEGLQEALIVLLERVTSDCFRPLNRMNVRLRTSGPPPRYRQSRSEPVKATSRRRRVAPAARRIVAGSRGCPLAWLNGAGSAAFG